jgi:uroporphyrin-3 C-methyltransferase
MSDQQSGSVDDKLEEAFEQMEKTQTEPKKNTAPGIGGTLAIFLSLIAIGVASYPAWEMYQKASAVPQEKAATGARLNKLEAQLENIRRQISELNVSLAESGSSAVDPTIEIEALRSELRAELEEVSSRIGTSSKDWLFAEVEYLVRMANQRVLMERDGASALKLLQTADEIIASSEGLTAHSLRQALALDIAALKAVNTADVQGIYLALSAMINQVPALKRSLPVFEPGAVATLPAAETDGYFIRFKAVLSKAVGRIASLVDFRHEGIEVKPILPPKEAYYLRQNLVMKLQIAQMALLEGNAEVFESAVSDAAAWVSTSFDEDDAGSRAMVKTLNELAMKNVSADLPDISGSLRASRNMLADFHKDKPE